MDFQRRILVHPQLDLYGEGREACDREREKIRLTYPTSKAVTVEYLKNRVDEDVDLSKID